MRKQFLSRYFSLPTSREEGFTLIEAMVSVTLLAVAIVGPITLAQRSIRVARDAKDQLTAEYLAIEGIELTRYVRDNYSANDASLPVNRTDWLNKANLWDKCSTGCIPLVKNGYATMMETCTNANCQLAGVPESATQIYQETATSLYLQDTAVLVGVTKTPYQRWITLEPIALSPTFAGGDPKREVKVTVRVRWFNAGVSHEIVLSETIMNWFPYLR